MFIFFVLPFFETIKIKDIGKIRTSVVVNAGIPDTLWNETTGIITYRKQC